MFQAACHPTAFTGTASAKDVANLLRGLGFTGDKQEVQEIMSQLDRNGGWLPAAQLTSGTDDGLGARDKHLGGRGRGASTAPSWILLDCAPCAQGTTACRSVATVAGDNRLDWKEFKQTYTAVGHAPGLATAHSGN